MQTDFSRFSYSSHIFWFCDILSKKSKFGACAVTGYCSFKWEWASEKQREEKSGKGSTSLSRSPQLQTVFSQLFSIYFPYDLGAWSATCRSSSEQSAQTVSFIIPLWWWNHIFVLLIETYVTLAKPCTHFTDPHLIEALCLYYSATPPYGHLGNKVTSLYSHYFSAPRNGHTFPYKKKTF